MLENLHKPKRTPNKTVNGTKKKLLFSVPQVALIFHLLVDSFSLTLLQLPIELNNILKFQ